MKIYVASSWRNERQPGIVKKLRNLQFKVYDFRNPEEGDHGFHWSEIDPDWEGWKPSEYISALDSAPAQRGFFLDMGAMKWADVCLLVNPCGRSAHLELGWFCGQGKPAAILLEDDFEPELMIKMADLITDNLDEVVGWLWSMESPSAVSSGTHF
jgi:hypothetical protein